MLINYDCEDIKKRARRHNTQVRVASFSQLIKLTIAVQSLVRLTAIDCETLSQMIPAAATTTTSDQQVVDGRINRSYDDDLQIKQQQISLPLDVTDLQIFPELRAAKLTWNYEYAGSVQPTAFSIKYCELTSWNDQIKCRQRESPVHNHQHLTPTLNNNNNNGLLPLATAAATNNPVISHLPSNEPSAPLTLQAKPLLAQGKHNYGGKQQELDKMSAGKIIVVQRGETWMAAGQQQPRRMLAHYEAHVYDLRAQTNYTFQVQVLRFNDDKLNNNKHLAADAIKSHINSARSPRQPSGRQLALNAHQLTAEQPTEPASVNEISDTNQSMAHRLANDTTTRSQGQSRVETKAFAAEATRCLADVSELVVNTGRYFGGRISVEDSQDPRCQLLGNRSSEQASYLFRIDHELCGSKQVSGNRFETIVLVHENKDILTHNTARFMVLCNFVQKSFTLKASVSLPKVNGLMSLHSQNNNHQQQLAQPTRANNIVVAANITQLPGKPGASHLHQPLLLPANSNSITDNVPSQGGEQLIKQQQQVAQHKLGDQPVRLGSMPGFFRAARHPAAASSQQQRPPPPQSQAQTMTQQQTPAWMRLVSSSPTEDPVDSPHANSLQLEPNHRVSSSSADSMVGHGLATPDSLPKASSSELSGSHPAPSMANLALLRRSPDLRAATSSRARSLSLSAWPQPQIAQSAAAATLDASAKPSVDIGTEPSSPKPVVLTMPLEQAVAVQQPEPVQVQSQVLFIVPSGADDPASSSGSAREARQLLPNGVSLIRSASSLLRNQQVGAHEPRQSSGKQADNGAENRSSGNHGPNNAAENRLDSNEVFQLANARRLQGGETLHAKSSSKKPNSVGLRPRGGATSTDDSVVMTNNHRVSDNFLSLSPPSETTLPLKATTATSLANSDNNYTIKYSGAPDVASYSYSDAHLSRSRNAAGLSLDSSKIANLQHNDSKANDNKSNQLVINSRMGKALGDELDDGRKSNRSTSSDMSQDQDLHQATVSDFNSNNKQQQLSLAQNITSQLLKFSLKTLTNVARRTVELLAKSNENKHTSGQNSSSVGSYWAPSAGDNANGDKREPAVTAGEQQQASDYDDGNNEEAAKTINPNADDEDYDDSDSTTTTTTLMPPAALTTTIDKVAHSAPSSLHLSKSGSSSHYQGREHVKQQSQLAEQANEATNQLSPDQASSSTSLSSLRQLGPGTSASGSKIDHHPPHHHQANMMMMNIVRHNEDDRSSAISGKPNGIASLTTTAHTPTSTRPTNDNNEPSLSDSDNNNNNNNNIARAKLQLSSSSLSPNNGVDHHAGLTSSSTTKRPLLGADQIAADNIDIITDIGKTNPPTSNNDNNTNDDDQLSAGGSEISDQTRESKHVAAVQNSRESVIRQRSPVAPGGHRASGSRSLKFPTAEGATASDNTDGFIVDKASTVDDLTKSETQNKKTASESGGKDNLAWSLRNHSEIFEFREPIRRRSLIYWPLFSLMLIASVASAFVLVIWFVSFRQHHFSAAFNHQVDSNANRRHHLRIGRKLGASSDGQNANNNNNNNGELRENSRHSHGNNNKGPLLPLTSDKIDNSNAKLIPLTNDSNNKIYATSKLLTKQRLDSISLGRASSYNTPSPTSSLPYSTTQEEGHGRQEDYSAVCGFANNNNNNNNNNAVQYDESYHNNNNENHSDDDPLRCHNQAKDVATMRAKKNATSRIRPRSHCSSHSDTTLSTSRGSFSQTSLSNGSTTMIGTIGSENVCRDNEVLYSDHVLINLGSHRGESYA